MGIIDHKVGCAGAANDEYRLIILSLLFFVLMVTGLRVLFLSIGSNIGSWAK